MITRIANRKRPITLTLSDTTRQQIEDIANHWRAQGRLRSSKYQVAVIEEAVLQLWQSQSSALVDRRDQQPQSEA